MNYRPHRNGDIEKRQWQAECGLSGFNAKQLAHNYDGRYVHPDRAKSAVQEASEKFDTGRWEKRCHVIYPVMLLVTFIDSLIESGTINEMGETRTHLLYSRINSAISYDNLSYSIPGGQCTTVQYEQISIFTQEDHKYIKRLKKFAGDFCIMCNQGIRYNQIRRVEDLPIMEVAHA